MHYIWLKRFNLKELFKIRGVSTAFRFLVDCHLKAYFREGPEIIGWVMEYDRKGVPFGCQKVSFQKESQNECQIEYKARYFDDVLDGGDYWVIQTFYEFEPNFPSKSIVHLNTCEAWISIRLLRMFDVPPYELHPHLQWGKRSPCSNALERTNEKCPLDCFHGTQIEFKLHPQTPLGVHDSLLNYSLDPIDLNFEFSMACQNMENVNFDIEIESRGESPPEALYLNLYGAEFTVEELKILLPQNENLSTWYDRVVLEIDSYQ